MVAGLGGRREKTIVALIMVTCVSIGVTGWIVWMYAAIGIILVLFAALYAQLKWGKIE